MSERRTEIVRAARDLFLEEGVSRFSMRRVAAKVGVTATALYRHFDDKADLLAEVVQEGHAIFGRYLMDALRGKDPLDRLLLAGTRYLDFAFEQPAFYRMIFLSWDQLGEDVSRRLHREGPGPTFQFLIDRVQECIASGAFRAGQEPMAVAVHLWALCHGLASLYLAGGGREQMPLPAWRQVCLRTMQAALGGFR